MRGPSFQRLAGFAGLLGVVVLVIVDFVLMDVVGELPDDDAPVGEIAAYFDDNAGTLELSSGLQKANLFLFALFFVGVFSLVSGASRDEARTWPVVGLFGAALGVAVAAAASAIETVAVWRAESLADQPELTATLWGVSVALFVVIQVGYALALVGLGAAGRQTGTIPTWLASIGFVGAGAGLLTNLFAVNSLDEGWAAVPDFFAFILFFVWILATSILLIVRGAPGRAAHEATR